MNRNKKIYSDPTCITNVTFIVRNTILQASIFAYIEHYYFMNIRRYYWEYCIFHTKEALWILQSIGYVYMYYYTWAMFSGKIKKFNVPFSPFFAHNKLFLYAFVVAHNIYAHTFESQSLQINAHKKLYMGFSLV